jgi:hypothetical protein
MIQTPNAAFLSFLDANPKAGRDALADIARVYLLEGGLLETGGLPGVPTVPGDGGDLICTVEGLVPVYRSDFAGEEDGRMIVARRARTVALDLLEKKEK